MAKVTLTPQQQAVVENRGGSLLVSAAAGSGKTKVLVERLFRYVTEEHCNVDDFLIITYTKAAAAELRGKIAAELTKRLAQQPGDQHLKRQVLRVYRADIKTVDAFCTALLRESTHLLAEEGQRHALTADFRVLDESEAKLLRTRVLERTLEAFYEELDPGREQLAECCRQAGEAGVVEIANYNCPTQLVLAGDAAAGEKAGELALQAGAKRVVPLKVSGPFHTSLMAPAGEALAEKFRSVAFGEMSFPVLFNCKGGPMEAGETLPELLVRQVQSSVYLEDTIRAMAGMGVDTIVEIGPGKALSAFVKKTEKGIKTYAVETVEDIEKLCEALKGEQA